MPESLASTCDAIWRKRIVFAKTRFAAPGPNSSSRRRSRGAEGRFGPAPAKSGVAWRRLWGSRSLWSKSRDSVRELSQHMSWPGRGASTAACCVGRSIHITRAPDPYALRLGRRSRRSSRRRSRSGPRKLEKLYVDGTDVLGRCLMSRMSRRRRGLPPILFLGEPRAEPKTTRRRRR